MFTELGVQVQLDWDRGVALISPDPGATTSVAASVDDFLDRHGDSVYTMVVRVPNVAAAEEVTGRCGSITRFRQGFSGERSYLDDLSVLGLPLTLLSTI